MIEDLDIPKDSYAVHAIGGQLWNVVWLFPNSGPDPAVHWAIKALWHLPIDNVRVERLTYWRDTDGVE